MATTKQDIIDHLTYNCGLHRSSAIKAVDGITEKISTALKEGSDVTLRGFGTFKVAQVAAKVGRDINKGIQVNIPAHNVVRFKPSAELKQALTENKE